MLEKLDNAIFSNHDIVVANEFSDNVAFLARTLVVILYTLTILSLMIEILTMMILKLLFILELWLAV